MHLKSISMQGFKSFAKKINIDLASSVTGVVGPNGSGKSNVAEAIRFVLGEQSMKGLRSKSGSDLIFKGSTHLSPLSRASVSVHLDNKEKKVNDRLINSNSDTSTLLSNFINLDEIILTREIYSDGVSEYLINNTKVRLKDVQELLAMANISTSGHTIVNQGEADRILLSSNNDRREIIEDALGLRIYHMRIKDGEKKLEKVRNHLNEIELVRKENLPELNYLKRQVKELEKREEEIKNINAMLKIYLYREDFEMENKKKEIPDIDIEINIQNLESDLNILSERKIDLEKNNTDNNIDNNTDNSLNTKDNEKEIFISKIKNLNEEISNLEIEKDKLYKDIVSIGIEKDFLIRKEEEIKNKKNNIESVKEDFEKYFIDKNYFNIFEGDRKTLWQEIFDIYKKQNYSDLNTHLDKAKSEEELFFENIKNLSKENSNKKIIEERETEINNFESKIEELDKNLSKNKVEFEILEKKIFNLKTEKDLEKEKLDKKEKEEVKEESEKSFKIDNDILKIKLELEKLYSQKENIKIKKENLRNQKENFENLLEEMRHIIGASVFSYKEFKEENMEDNEKNISILSQYELYKKIERSKIKIEESGITNADDTLKEYERLLERDEFLSKEILDLETSRKNLENLIQDLKNTLLEDFNIGLQKINTNFNNYFNEIFSGGKASLSLEKTISNKINTEIQSDIEDDIEENEPGIEIKIDLPQKKVKDLQMLSGGERALSSIALIFAMSSINHPPFMVLDETDAALDESNARKYGKMIKKLAEKSKLLVITHNRETMNQCDVLYGVTIGAEGSSKLLSIKFDEATEYAK